MTERRERAANRHRCPTLNLTLRRTARPRSLRRPCARILQVAATSDPQRRPIMFERALPPGLYTTYTMYTAPSLSNFSAAPTPIERAQTVLKQRRAHVTPPRDNNCAAKAPAIGSRPNKRITRSSIQITREKCTCLPSKVKKKKTEEKSDERARARAKAKRTLRVKQSRILGVQSMWRRQQRGRA
jgi:hypothetical protein